MLQESKDYIPNLETKFPISENVKLVQIPNSESSWYKKSTNAFHKVYWAYRTMYSQERSFVGLNSENDLRGFMERTGELYNMVKYTKDLGRVCDAKSLIVNSDFSTRFDAVFEAHKRLIELYNGNLSNINFVALQEEGIMPHFPYSLLGVNAEIDFVRDRYCKLIGESVHRFAKKNGAVFPSEKSANRTRLKLPKGSHEEYELNLRHSLHTLLTQEFSIDITVQGMLQGRTINLRQSDVIGMVNNNLDFMRTLLNTAEEFINPQYKVDIMTIGQLKENISKLRDGRKIMAYYGIELSVEEGEDISILGEQIGWNNIWINDLMHNLIANSRDAYLKRNPNYAFENEGFAQVTFSKEGQGLVMEYTDKAGGLPQRILDEGFQKGLSIGKNMDRETRIQLQGSAYIGGSGLGMAKALEIAEKYGVRVVYGNWEEDGQKGAWFKFIIPPYKDSSSRVNLI